MKVKTRYDNKAKEFEASITVDSRCFATHGSTEDKAVRALASSVAQEVARLQARLDALMHTWMSGAEK